MSFVNLKKKLSPAGKAWKGFASSLQTHLLKLSNSKSIKRTKKRLNTIILGRRCSSRYYSPPETKSWRKKRRVLFHRGFKPVYVDQLFATSSTSNTVAVSVRAMGVAAGKGGGGRKPEKVDDGGGGSGSSGSCAVPAMPWEVDERAEKFIADFHREMSLQRERSLDEYQEMISRSA